MKGNQSLDVENVQCTYLFENKKKESDIKKHAKNEHEKKMLKLKRAVLFKQLQYEEMLQIGEHISWYPMLQDDIKETSSGNPFGNPLWIYILREIKPNDKKIKEIIDEYEPEMYWIRKTNINLMNMKDISKQIEREDVVILIENWFTKALYANETKINAISKTHQQQLASSIKIQPSRWNDWQLYADQCGYHTQQINEIHSLAKDEMKVLAYIYENYGKTNINIIKSIAKKYKMNKQKLTEIEQTLRKIVYEKYDKR